MTTKCVDCSLFQFLVQWMLTDGLFWIFLVVILTWFTKNLPADERSDQLESKKKLDYATKVLGGPPAKSRKDALVQFTIHVGLFIMEFVEGYWLLTSWWHYVRGYWSWTLKRSEWTLQFFQFVVLVLLAIALPVLLFVGVGLLTTTIVCLNDLWKWKPESCNGEDTWHLVRREEEEEEEQGKDAEQTFTSTSQAPAMSKNEQDE